MKIEDAICKYKKKIEHRKEEIKEYRQSGNEELRLAADTLERDMQELELILSALELAKAEAEGRLVVLPCKVGDTVFFTRWSFKTVKHEIFTGVVKNVRYDSYDKTVSISNGEKYGYLGKTVFLTREAAEKALGGEQNA